MRKHNYFLRYMKMAPDDGSGGASSAPSPSGDGGGASVSPSPSGGDSGGSPPASPSPDSGSTETASPWENLGSSDDLDFIEIQQEKLNPPVPPPAEPPPPPAPVATPEPAAAAPPPASAAPQQQPAPQATPPAEPLSPADPAGIAAAMYQHRDQAIAHLAQDRFALTPEDIAELETDAAAFVPKMMARVAFETQASMYKFLAQAVPGMITKHTTTSKANTDAESKFFELNKDRGLDPKNAEHKATAARLAGMYRQANPSMPFEQLASEVGLMVATALKIQASPTQPGAPVAIPRGGQAFRPAVGGGGGASPAPAPADEWAGLGRNFDEG